MSRPRLSPLAFATLLLIALMMGANHVAARLAFNSGLDVATAVASRSLVTSLVVVVIVLSARVSRQINRQQARGLVLAGLLIGLQSQCLYSAVARLPVALALDVMGAASGLGADAHWTHIGTGVLFALAGSASFGLALVVVQHETAGVDGRVRTACTMFLAGAMALAVIGLQGGPHWPQSATGWWGMATLTLLYGTAFTIMFTVLPRLGVAGNSAIMNVEPVFALVLAWAILDQAIAPVQLVGALVVVGAVMWLGLRKG